VVARISKDGLWRVSYNEDTKLTFQEVVDNQPAKFERILPGNPKPGDYKLVNISPYRTHQRCSERFRVGRILLAADAAHLCNPWGGLGLTGGFADITGLAECLGGIAAGQADHSILDKYDEVRRAIYHSVIDPISTGNFLRVSTLDPNTALEKDHILALYALANKDQKLKEKLHQVFISLTLNCAAILTRLQGTDAICHDFTQYFTIKV
jgi:2-polyprenyl-6-methoxyphenol hydroxylase-like FAD-dependent oxidoreductase